MELFKSGFPNCALFVFVLVEFAASLPADVTTLDSVVPLEFPKNLRDYNFVDNSSIRENLVNRSKNDTEVEDLLEDAKETSEPLSILIPIPAEPTIVDEDLDRKNDTEWIENGEDTEDSRTSSRMPSEITESVVIEKNENMKHRNFPLFEGQIAAILAGTFLIISMAAYVGLMTWRRRLEEIYGSRQMLVNEDDFNDPDDIKHFSI